MKYFILATLFILINSCSSLSKEECTDANWTELGHKDALAGKMTPQDSVYQKDCKEHGLSVNKKDYNSGFNSGLKLYCNYKNGYDLGLKGKRSHLYCEKISEEFKVGFKVGFKDFQKVQKKKVERDSLKKHLISLNGQSECPTSKICKKEGTCSFNKCSHNGQTCTWNNDCEEFGHCIPVSGYTPSQELVTVEVCRFINY